MKNRWPLIAAAAFGLAALLVMNQSAKRKQAQDLAGARYRQVAFPRGNLPAGAELKPELLVLKPVPEQFVPDQAVAQEDLNRVFGRKLSHSVRGDRLLSFSDLESETAVGFTRNIPSGEGAFTVSIAKGIKPGLIQPGDHIDLLATFSMPKASDDVVAAVPSWRQASSMVNAVLLQNVTILAVGDSYHGSPHRESGGGTELTLALTQRESQLVMLASQHGELGAMLRPERSVDTRPRSELRPISYREIEQIIGDLDDNRSRRTIEVQKGSRTLGYPVPVPDDPAKPQGLSVNASPFNASNK